MPNGRWPYNNLPFMQSGNTAKRSGWRRYREESGKQIADRFVSSFWMCVNLWGRRSGQGKARQGEKNMSAKAEGNKNNTKWK